MTPDEKRWRDLARRCVLIDLHMLHDPPADVLAWLQTGEGDHLQAIYRYADYGAMENRMRWALRWAAGGYPARQGALLALGQMEGAVKARAHINLHAAAAPRFAELYRLETAEMTTNSLKWDTLRDDLYEEIVAGIEAAVMARRTLHQQIATELGIDEEVTA